MFLRQSNCWRPQALFRPLAQGWWLLLASQKHSTARSQRCSERLQVIWVRGRSRLREAHHADSSIPAQGLSLDLVGFTSSPSGAKLGFGNPTEARVRFRRVSPHLWATRLAGVSTIFHHRHTHASADNPPPLSCKWWALNERLGNDPVRSRLLIKKLLGTAHVGFIKQNSSRSSSPCPRPNWIPGKRYPMPCRIHGRFVPIYHP
jgi:hypothetical protein